MSLSLDCVNVFVSSGKFQFLGIFVPNWSNKTNLFPQIKKPLRPAYISLHGTGDSLLFQVDVTSPDVTIVNGNSVSFTLPLNLPLQFENTYKIRVDEWLVASAQDCDLSRPESAEWRFTFQTFCQDGGEGFEPLVVLPLESHPRPGGNISRHDIRIQYNKLVGGLKQWQHQ